MLQFVLSQKNENRLDWSLPYFLVLSNPYKSDCSYIC